jgi:putative ABC transport system substrate-binding protein
MVNPGDPVASGLVASLARPGGNVTGLSQFSPQLSTKRLELLTQAAPALARVAVLTNPTNAANSREWEELQPAAHSLNVALQRIDARGTGDLPVVQDAAIAGQADGLVVLADPVLNGMRGIVDFAAANRLPAIYAWKPHAENGGLMSYGPDPDDLFRRAATYVDKLLRGANAAELPVEQPTRFDFVVNLGTTQALGLTIPPAVLAQATEILR